ncbi:hypothetical protein P3T76_004307 [Phytophthora citrophthora]|uniref:Uncharacterized protein n=1 Tax=Phytophthora citrophthora TaxID=4793 RepID=A0AAD9GT76_9STRA|nr:hypothetical protein P3T76_004307 [Phytophthora citrophthora]
MIKTKHSPTFTCDARDLTLYLTKKNMDDKVWLLTKNQVEVGDVGIDGFMLLYAGAKLLYSGLSALEVALTVEEIEKAKEDGGPVNILVELPKEALENLRWNRLLPTL